MKEFKINKNLIGNNRPAYFIADIAANHDGSLLKAKELIFSCADAGANAAKFQHFNADTIVSDNGFKKLNKKFLSHQKNWKKSVYKIYQEASINLEWTNELQKTCKKAKIDFISTPYSYELANHLEKFIPAYKIGSGDISWSDFILFVAKKKKPLIIATGATKMSEISKLLKKIEKINNKIVLMQCNTNYTGNKSNLNFINLNVLKSFKKRFPNVILGLSDHTFGHASVLGAISLGARVIEKHFTLNNKSNGPDHFFSMNPKTWREMIDRSRELEACLGSNIKKVEKNEKDTVIIQRRSWHASKDIDKNSIISNKDIICLRPCPIGSFEPDQIDKVVGKKSLRFIAKGSTIFKRDVR